MKTLLCTFAITAMLMIASQTATAAIFLDFGGGDAPIGTEVGPAGFSATWQTPSNATGIQNLLGGETLETVRGANTSANSSLTWGSNGTPSTGASTPPGGSIMATESNVYTDYMRLGDNGRALGLRIQGLAPGIYDVWLVINDASTEAGSRAAIGTLDGTAGNGPHDLDDLDQITSALLTDSDRSLDEWTASTTAGNAFNFIQASITIDDTSDYLVVFLESFRGAGTDNQLGIHSLQISLVPEPATAGLLALGSLALLARRRQKA